MLIRLKKAQGATEYAIFIAAVLIALIAIQIYFQRSVKGKFKSSADQVGDQFFMGQAGDGIQNTYQTSSVSARRSLTGSGAADLGGNAATTSSELMSDTEYAGNANLTSVLNNLGAAGISTGRAAAVTLNDNYRGGSVYMNDWVDATAGDGDVGDHDVMETGDFRNQQVFEEGGQTATP